MCWDSVGTGTVSPHLQTAVDAQDLTRDVGGVFQRQEGVCAGTMSGCEQQMCDRAYVLENGRVVLEGTGNELSNNPHVKEAYLGI